MVVEYPPRRHLPRLMLPSTDSDPNRPCYGYFHNIFDDNVHHQDMHQLHNKQCVGSSHGWLIMVDDKTPSLFAVNPLEPSTRVNLLTFPNIKAFGNEYVYWSYSLWDIKRESTLKSTYIKKVVLSKDPTHEGCVVVAIYGERNRLALCRVGDKKWTFTDNKRAYLSGYRHYLGYLEGYEDVVFDKGGRFYAVNHDGVITTCDCVTPFLELVYEPQPPLPMENHADKRYVVFDNKGRLLMVNRYIEEDTTEDSDSDSDYDDSESEDDGDSDDDEGESDDSDSDDDESETEDDSDNDDDDGDESETEDADDCDDNYKTSGFSVFIVNEENKLVEVEGLEGGILFLGKNESLFLSPMEFSGVESDSIYFTDDELIAHNEPSIGGRDIGVFHMNDGFITGLKCCSNEGKGIWPPPIWVTLTLNNEEASSIL